MIAMAALLAGAAQEKPEFPTAGGTRWVYRLAGEKTEQTWELGKGETITVLRTATKNFTGIRLDGFWQAPKDRSYLVVTDEAVLLVTTRHVGYAGTPALVIAAEFRWGKEKEWKFTTINGCIVDEVKCSRGAEEKVSVPAGAYDCTRFEIGADTYWIAKGVGIVKMAIRPEMRRTGKETVYELAKFETGK